MKVYIKDAGTEGPWATMHTKLQLNLSAPLRHTRTPLEINTCAFMGYPSVQINATIL